MNDASVLPGQRAGAGTGGTWLWVAAALSIGLLAVTRDSLWIDEALTANEVSQVHAVQAWQMLAHDKASDLQMPLYIFHLWLWVKLFGHSEWALRAVNILWYVGGFSTLVSAFNGREKTALALVALFSPFTWYYLNEARPYAMQIGASLMALAALRRLGQTSNPPSREGKWIAIFCFSLVCLSGSSLLGMIWACGCIVAAWTLIPAARLRELSRVAAPVLGITFLVLVSLGAFYLWTLGVGARATSGKTDARNLIFIAYELLGFGGLGPGRLEIRDGALGAFTHYAAPLAVYGTALAGVALLAIAGSWRNIGMRPKLGLLFAIVAPAAIILTAGRVVQFRVLDRHFAPVITVVVLMAGLGVADAWRRPGIGWRAMSGVFIALCAMSCLEVRFAPRQKKDDYRAAAAAAQQALNRDQVVWWSASQQGADYYRVTPPTAGSAGAVVTVINRAPGELAGLAAPSVVITSKPDLFDQQAALSGYLRNNPYQVIAEYPAFQVWERSPNKPQ